MYVIEHISKNTHNSPDSQSQFDEGKTLLFQAATGKENTLHAG